MFGIFSKQTNGLLVFLGMAGVLLLSALFVLEKMSAVDFGRERLLSQLLMLCPQENEAFVLQEAGSMKESCHSSWWVNAGGYVLLNEYSIATIQGSLGYANPWRLRYAVANPQDTYEGYHPQNLLRLVRRELAENAEQVVYFRIHAIRMSKSPERGPWSGVFFMNRYQDDNNVYYSGIRQDGSAVIKKKSEGIYYTLAEQKLFGLDMQYDRDTNPNLIPGKKWIGMKSVIRDTKEGVNIQFYVDPYENGEWHLALETLDKNNQTEIPPIEGIGHGGLRSDFLDIEFKEYSFAIPGLVFPTN